jgi:hypothetical protein
MVWNSGAWLVDKVDDVQRPAPAPVLVYNDPNALKATAFERDLRGMTAPTYGVAR